MSRNPPRGSTAVSPAGLERLCALIEVLQAEREWPSLRVSAGVLMAAVLAALGFGGRFIRCLLGFDHPGPADKPVWWVLLRDTAPPRGGTDAPAAPTLTVDDLVYEPHPDADEQP